MNILDKEENISISGVLFSGEAIGVDSFTLYGMAGCASALVKPQNHWVLLETYFMSGQRH